MGGFVDGLTQLSGAIAPIGVFASPLAFVTGYWGHKRSTRKQSDGVAIELVKQLRAELASDRAAAAAERAACTAELKAERHKRVNLAMCVDALLTGYDLPPNKMSEHVARIRLRLDHLATEDAGA